MRCLRPRRLYHERGLLVTKSEFEKICRVYFPRWRNAIMWNICEGSRGEWIDSESNTKYTSDLGYCDFETRTIWQNDTSAKTLIHEICHAVTGTGHGKKFIARMRTTATKARALGESELACSLFKEAETYENTPSLTAKAVYRRVADIAMDGIDIPIHALIDYLAYEYGFTAPEIRKRYRRIEQVYKAELRKWQP